MKTISIFLLAAAAFSADTTDVSGERMRAHVKFLASDQLEGRGVGTRGEKLATEYIAAQFDSAGAKPAGENGTFFQRVPMVGAATESDATLSAIANNQTGLFSMAGRLSSASANSSNLRTSSTPKPSSSATA